MKRFTILLLVLLIPLSLGISACAQIAPVVQADIGKLKAEIQAQKANLLVQIPPAITYATAKGDVVFCDCLNAFQTALALPDITVPDISNKLIDAEIAHQATVAGLGGVASLEADPVVQTLFRGCSAYIARTKGEILSVMAQIAALAAH